MSNAQRIQFIHFTSSRGVRFIVNVDAINRVEQKGGKLVLYYAQTNGRTTRVLLSGEEMESVLNQLGYLTVAL